MEQNSNKGVIITIIVIVIIIILGLLLWKGNTSETLLPITENQNATTTETVATSTATSTNQVATSTATSTSQTSTKPKTVTVTYTDTGYTPKSITINKGDTVKFVNDSSGPMWTASARHPDHTLYPEKTANDCLGSAFDQCKSVNKGGSYSFTFNQVGSWNYHNHSNSSQFGTVVVK